MIKFTKKQFNDLLNCHLGVGIIALKTSDDTLTYIDFYISNKGIPCHCSTGKPIVWESPESAKIHP